MKSAFISGVSTGIGHSLAKLLLARGDVVYGVSRRMPEDLSGHPNFHFFPVDFAVSGLAGDAIGRFLDQQRSDSFTNVFLNAGYFGKRIARVSDIALADLEEQMRVNLWSHKLVLDAMLRRRIAIGSAVFSASIAGVRARAGNSGYAITKAALNMMAKLYALEHPGIRFMVLGMCSVDTPLSETIGRLPLEGDFPEIAKLRERATDARYSVSADRRAADIIGLLDDGPGGMVPNGDFVEIRSLVA